MVSRSMGKMAQVLPNSGDMLASVLQHFRKGARVKVEGELHLNEYNDADGAHHAGLRLTAESVALLPYRIETLTFAPSRREREGDAGQGGYSRERAHSEA